MRKEFSMKLIMMFVMVFGGILGASSTASACNPSSYCGDCYPVEKQTECEREKADLEYRRARTKAMEKCAQNGNCVFSN